MKRLTREELAHGRQLIEAAFAGPWQYSQFEIECQRCDAYQQGSSEQECVNPECDGTHVPATFVEAPAATPSDLKHPLVVATIDVPGVSTWAEKNGEAICWAHNNMDALLSANELLLEMGEALAWLFVSGHTPPPGATRAIDSVINYAKGLGWRRDK
jgi:hypothetical protein